MSRSATSNRSFWKKPLMALLIAAILAVSVHRGFLDYVNAHTGDYVGAARRYIAAGQDEQALAVLRGVSGASAAVARSQAYLEEGSDSMALSALQNDSGVAVIAQRNLGAAVQHADSATALALAQALYADKLYRTVGRVLNRAPVSSSKYQLLVSAQLQLQPLTTQDLQTAQSTAEEGSGLYPANLELHQALEYIDTQLHDAAGAAEQAQLIKQLQAGTI